MILELTILLFSAAAAFLLRLMFSVCAASDTRGFLWRFHRLKDKFSVYYDLDDCIIPAKHGYPILFQLVLSKLPEGLWVHVGYILNSLFDIVIALIFFIILKQLKINNVSVYLPLITAIFYLFTPALTPISARMMAFNGRAIGALFYLIYFLLLFYIIEYSVNLLLPFCVAMLIIIVLTSHFAFQAVTFSTIGISLLYLLIDKNILASTTVILLPLITLFVAYFLPKLGVRDALRYFWGLYVWQYKNRKTGTMPAVRSRWIITFWHQIRLGKIKLALNTIYRQSPEIITLLYAPALVFIFILIIQDAKFIQTLLEVPIGRHSLYLVISLFSASIFTSWGVGLIFGQAERYMEYAAPYINFVAIFGILVMTINDEQRILLLLLLLIINIMVSLLNLVNASSVFGLLFGGKNDLITGKKSSFVRSLDRFPNNANVLPVPLTEGKKLSLQNKLHGIKKINTLYDWISPEGQFPLEYMNQYFRGIQYYPDGFKSIISDMKIDATLITKSKAIMWMSDHHETDWKLFLSNLPADWKIIFEDDDYVMLASSKVLKKIDGE